MRKILLAWVLCALPIPAILGQVIQREISFYDNPVHHLRENIERGKRCVAMNDSGEVYVTASTVIPDSGIATVIIKFSRDGSVAWTRQLGDMTHILERLYIPHALTLDKEGNIYIAGYENTEWSTTDGFYYKLSPEGSLLSEGLFNEHRGTTTVAHHHTFNAIAADERGNAYVAGQQFDDQAVVMLYKGNAEYRLAKYDSTYAAADNIIYDGKGHLYVTLSIAADTLNLASTDILLVKYDTIGTHLWTRKYTKPSPTGYAWTQEVHSDKAGNVYLLVTNSMP